ncbi:hypothetical protein [uncultured Prevotella sp.]|uniref:hypothetical protein n=1 Tax=uncultured Prevotella sp. TaxID=159272 RepID=UPI0025E7A1C6|nr:hypothetical protein [uncultured Prevotella sp.]
MNRNFILHFILLFFATTALAQTQQGYVKTKGRLGSNGAVIHGTPLSGATVTVKGSNAVLSANNGKFSLVIPSNSYYLQSVQKQGYVLTDPDVLSKQYMQSKNPLTIVMEDKAQQAADRRAMTLGTGSCHVVRLCHQDLPYRKRYPLLLDRMAKDATREQLVCP